VNRWRSSPRFRRRSLWALALLGAAGGLAAVGVGIQNTPDFPPQHLQDRPPQFTPEPHPKALTRAEAAQVWGATTRFLRTAVAHRQLRTAYDLVGPDLRGGMTRAEWATGENPVVPFPVKSIDSWTLAYAYRNDVAIDLGLVALPGSDTVAKAFRIELQRKAAGAPWKVVTWMPLGVSGPGNVRSIRETYRRAPPPPEPTTLAAWWLAFPGALLGLVLVLPVALWLRSWHTGRKAERAYRDAVGLSQH
jgi:hypothetical protein